MTPDDHTIRQADRIPSPQRNPLVTEREAEAFRALEQAMLDAGDDLQAADLVDYIHDLIHLVRAPEAP